MTDDPIEPPPATLMERLAAVEQKSATMELALRKAFGDRWMDEQAKPNNDAE
jgi:hypothetical protein